MSLKAELETWVAALAAYDAENFREALTHFFRIAESSKIFTNIGLIYATVGDHQAAITHFEAAIELDQYLAVAYFQSGVSNFVLARYEAAWHNFEEASAHLRGNQCINYEQLGLNFKLFSCEILFNMGLSLIYLGRGEEGLRVLITAAQDKVIEEHSVIDEAIHNRGAGYTVFSMPVGVLYRPSEIKVKNVKQKDYMGKAKLVATADTSDVDTAFAGVSRLKQGSGTQDDLISAPELIRSVTAPPPRFPGSLAVSVQRSNTDMAPLRVRGLSAPDALHGYDRADETRANETRVNEPRERSRGPGNRNVASDGQYGRPTRTNTMSNPIPPVLQPSVAYTAANFLGSPESDSALKSSRTINDYIDSYRNVEPPRPPSVDSDSRKSANSAKASSRGNETSRVRDSPSPNSSSRQKPLFRTISSVYPQEPQPKTKPPKTKVPRSQSRTRKVREEEEGYASADPEEVPPPVVMTKIRVKVHYQGDIRGMALTPDTMYEEFMDNLSTKFGVPETLLDVKFKDEDGAVISLRDDMDYELAMETVTEAAKGKKERRLEIWCTDV